MLSGLAPVLAGAIFFRRLPRMFKFLFIYAFIVFLNDIAVYSMASMHLNNMALIHFYTFLEFTFISFVYYQIAMKKWFKVIVLIAAIFFYLFSILNLVFLESLDAFNSIQSYVEGIVILIYTLLYFGDLLSRDVFIYLERSPLFWLNCGFLVYFAGTFFLFIFNTELTRSSEGGYWILHAILYIWLNLIYAVSLWMSRKT